MSEDDIEVRVRQFANLIRKTERGEYIISLLDDCLADCPHGVNHYWKSVPLYEGSPTCKTLSKQLGSSWKHSSETPKSSSEP
ncbi:MAG: hypothetical protein PHN89_04795 [Candidatus Pacebacteria bacterium]|nr:hypothetical protein [Candidatus Paceibacterota bacterium]